MDDNATCHRTLAVQDCLDNEGIQRLVWPARSPDLNPIENVWDALGRQVSGRNYPPTNKNTLIRALTEEWDKLPQQLLDNVVQTICDPSLAIVQQCIMSAYTRQKAKSKNRNRIRLERASQEQSKDITKTPLNRIKRCRERKRMNVTERINNGASTSVAGAVEIMHMDNKIASILTPDCEGIDYVRWSFRKTYWAAASARFITTVAGNAISDDLIEHLQCDRSSPKSEILLARQNLAISEIWMEDCMIMNVLGFDLRSSYNTARSRQIATTSSVAVLSSSSNRKAGGVTAYRNINSFTYCNRVNIDLGKLTWE
ncbi:uncharacterized protein TNCV_3325801 [Trichonephila clavipes]|nr:uncharacterized protein TNCV_3325801 [Trichonephila clavipes]